MTTRTNIPQDFLDYRIEEPIGQGGMGVVYLAHDVRLGRRVALKVMAPSLARDGRYRASFARESELAMSLEHPNVVPIHDAGEAEGRLYLAMRRVEGTDLRALLRREGALDPARALAIVSQIAQALDAAHAKGLVHRDVKPSNVLLDDNEHVYLADFGLTRRLSEGASLQAEAATLGTPAYLAPEQIEGGDVDGRADVLLARLPALRVPDGRAAVPGRFPACGRLGTPRTGAAGRVRAQARAARRGGRGDQPGDGEGPGRPVRDVSRACGRGRERADPARSAPAPLGARGGRSLGSGRRGAARRCVSAGAVRLRSPSSPARTRLSGSTLEPTRSAT